MLKGTVAVLLARALGAGVEVRGRSPGSRRSSATAGRRSSGSGAAAAWRRRSAGCSPSQPLIALAILPAVPRVIAITRYSSLGSLVGSAAAGILLVVATYVIPLDPWMYVYAVGGTGLVWLFHADNIGRLLRGQERKIGTPPPAGRP